jgi:hypothetical protein
MVHALPSRIRGSRATAAKRWPARERQRFAIELEQITWELFVDVLNAGQWYE